MKVEESIKAYYQALEIEPDNLVNKCAYNHARLKICDWQNYQKNNLPLFNLPEFVSNLEEKLTHIWTNRQLA